MAANASLSWALQHGVLLVVQAAGLPGESDWSQYHSEIATLQFHGALVVGDGNKLTVSQRSDVEAVLKRNGAKNALVTSSSVTRGMLTALSWLGVPVKAFGRENIRGALAYLSVAPELHEEMVAQLERLRRDLLAYRVQAAVRD